MKQFVYVLCCSIFILSCTVKPPQTEQVEEKDVENDQHIPSSIKPIDPLSASLLIDGGQLKLMGEYSKAIQFFQRAIEFDKNNDAAHYELALLYKTKELEDKEKALTHIQKAANIDPTNQLYQVILGRSLVDQGNIDEGVRSFEKLVQENPLNRDYVFDLAYSYEKAGQPQKAIDLFDELEEKYGINPEINHHKHVLYFELGEKQKGIEELEEIVEEFPEYVTYANFITDYYYQQKQYSQAIKYADISIAQQGEEAKIYVYKLQSYIALNDETGISHTLLQIANAPLQLDQKIQLFYPLIDLLLEQPDYAERIISAVKQLSKNYPQEAKVFALYGDVLFNAGYKTESITEYEKSLTLNDEVYTVWEQLILYYLNEKDYVKMAEVSSRAHKKFPQYILPAYMAGFANVRLSNYSKAISFLQKASTIEDKDDRMEADIYSLLGDTYYNLNDFSNSFLYFDKALLIEPDNTFVLNNYSYYLALQKQHLSKALKMAERVYLLDPKDIGVIHTYGYVLYVNKNYKKALNFLKQAAMELKTNALVVEHYGDALFKTNRVNEAIKQWGKALQLDPNNKELQQKINNGKID